METSDVLYLGAEPMSALVAGDMATTDSQVLLQAIYENGVEQADLQASSMGVMIMLFLVLTVHMVRQWGR